MAIVEPPSPDPTPSVLRPPPTSPRTRRLLALGLPLAASLVIAASYVESVRRHSRAVDAAGERLAGMVSRDLADMVFIRTGQGLGGVLRDGINPYAVEMARANRTPDPGTILERLAAAADSLASCECAPWIPLEDLVVVDRATGQLHTRSRRDEVWTRRLAGDLLDGTGERLRPLAGTDPDGTAWFAFVILFPAHADAVVGLEIDLDRYGAVLFDEGLALLAASFFHEAPLETALAVELQHGDGHVLYQRGAIGSGPTAEIELYGNEAIPTYVQLPNPLRATVTIAPEALSDLIPGGLPRSPLFPALLILGAIGLGGVGTRLLAREQALAEARQRFLLSVQHEMRTPLAQIRAYGETLQLDRPVPEARRRAGDVIVREADRLTALVENALHVAHADPRRPGRLDDDVDVGRVLARLDDSISLLVRQRHLDLDLRNATARRLRTDPDRLHRLLLALTENAVRYSEHGASIEVEAADDGPRVAIRVVDHGPGIPASERARLWAPFETMDRAGRSGGTGLGLTIARDLASGIGAELDIADTPGGGTTFVVRVEASGAADVV